MLVAASTMRGASPALPWIAYMRSACSVLVGMPVPGPLRMTSTTTTGISDIDAMPMSSLMRHSPGPDVAVIARTPAYDAPRHDAMAAISSSAWTTFPPNAGRCFIMNSSTCVAGVMGYPATYRQPPAIAPRLSDWLPDSTTRPAALDGTAGRASFKAASRASPFNNESPASNAFRLVATTSSPLRLNCFVMRLRACWVGMSMAPISTASATMFFAMRAPDSFMAVSWSGISMRV